MKREPAELIVIEHPVEENKKILDIADYDGDYDDEDYDYVDFTAEEERMAAQQGRVKGGGLSSLIIYVKNQSKKLQRLVRIKVQMNSIRGISRHA